MTANVAEKIHACMGTLMVVAGTAGVLAPDRVNASAAEGSTTDESAYLTRMWALRESALGLILLGTRRSPRRRGVLAVVTGLAAAEIVVGLRSPALTGRSQSSTIGTAAAFAVAGVIGVLADQRRDVQAELRRS